MRTEWVFPSRLMELLSGSQQYRPLVDTRFSFYEPIVRWNSLPFFPEFTDHGKLHIESVLAAVCFLIPERSFEKLSEIDAAVLCLAVLFHDLGMHISEERFITLVDPINDQIAHPGIDTYTWPMAWEHFLSEALRWDAEMLNAILGDGGPLRRPSLNTQSMTRRDRLLVGEFLRRNHPRLAHEIATSELLSTTTMWSHDKHDIYDMAGLVARSHGLALRALLPHINESYHLREYQQCHLVYLMVVLRIADYVQLQPNRAPYQRLTVSDLVSPISRREWNFHSSITNITLAGEDPEALIVTARPKSAEVFLRVKALLRDLQREVDTSWAVLGEVYGRFEHLHMLGVTVRRVKSNLDDISAFEKTVDYVPHSARFEVAKVDLLQLMVGPLYGENPTFGIRELLQNSVDACLELKDFMKKHNIGSVDGPAHNADVLITMTNRAEDAWTLTVSDRGIGMTIETVLNYFLKAGASFRRSDFWKKAHENESGKSTLLRSGRFGIGGFAAFLLGDELRVTTRHASSSKGITFAAKIGSRNIEIKKVSAYVGTVIEIDLSPEAAWRLRTDLQRPTRTSRIWTDQEYTPSEGEFGSLPDKLYLIEEPSIQIECGGTLCGLGLRWPSAAGPVFDGWNDLASSIYTRIHWTYLASALLACNGMAIRKHAEFSLKAWEKQWDGRDVLMPTISIFDSDAKLPLNLNRESLVREPDYIEEVAYDVARSIVAKAHEFSWCEDKLEGYISGSESAYEHPAYRESLLFLRQGFTFLDRSIICNLRLETIVILQGFHKEIEFPLLSDQTAIIKWPSDSTGPEKVFEAIAREKEWYGLRLKGARVVYPWAMMSAQSRKTWPQKTSQLFTNTWTLDRWGASTVGKVGYATYDIKEIKSITHKYYDKEKERDRIEIEKLREKREEKEREREKERKEKTEKDLWKGDELREEYLLQKEKEGVELSGICLEIYLGENTPSVSRSVLCRYIENNYDNYLIAYPVRGKTES